MRSLQKALCILAILPAAMAGCSSDSNGGGGSGGSGGSGGKGGSGGSTGGSTGGTGTGGSTGGTGTGGSTGGSTGGTGTGGSTGGTGTGGSGGSTGGSTGGADGPPSACGGMKKAPTGTVIDNFDGMSQVAGGWILYHAADTAVGKPITPMGSMEVTVVGKDTYVATLLAMWAASNRPCMDGSAYQGIRFKASGTVKDLYVRIGTPATYPVAEGGICMDNMKCGWTHYQKNVSATLMAGGTAQVAFSELMAPWGAPDPFDKSALLSLVFLTTDPDTTMTKKFTIDDIEFY
jgi:hypothetical protein